MHIRERIKRFGLIRAVIAALGRRGRKFFNIWVILERQLVAGFEVPPEHAKYEFRQVTLEDALTVSQDSRLEMTPEFIRAAFDRGDYCCGAFLNGELVAYLWRSQTVAPVTERLQLRVDHRPQFYGYKSFVLPAHRGNRLIKSVGRVQDQHFIENNITSGIGYVSLFNLSSLENYLREPDHEKIGYAGYISFAGRDWTFRTPGARKAFTFERIGMV